MYATSNAWQYGLLLVDVFPMSHLQLLPADIFSHPLSEENSLYVTKHLLKS
jgi:hypothetical protein